MRKKPFRQTVVALAILLAAWWSGTLLAQTDVTFPDPNLEAAIRSALNKPTGALSSQELESLNYLHAYNANITSLSGLEWATNLTALDLGGNAIRDLTALPNLKQLSSLFLQNNFISDISPLSGLTNLNYLVLSYNPITNNDVLLTGFTNLSSLYFGGNSVSNVTFLKNLERLTFLGLENNQISDLSPLAALTNLTGLDLSYNPLTNLVQLGGLTNLTGLYLSGVPINDLSVLQPLKGLTALTLYRAFISDVSFLAELTNLNELGLNGNSITDHGLDLLGCTNLTRLDLAGNCISNLNFLAALTRLESLDLRNNRIDDISVLDGLTNLISVDLDFNNLADVATLQDLTQLTRAGLVGNLLEPSAGSADLMVIQALEGRNVIVTYEPQNLPPIILSAPAKWAIATNVPSSLTFYVYDDMTPDNQCEQCEQCDRLRVMASSSDTNLIPNEGISFAGTNYSRTITLTPTANQTGTATITLAVTDDAGLSSSVTVLVSVMIPIVVAFPDSNLEAVIHQTLGKPAGNLTSVDLQTLSYLYAYNTNITDLSGLEWATNLTSLFLNGNSVSNLTVLSTLPGLSFFSLENNRVADLSLLTGLTNVTGLRLNGDAITNLTFLQNMPQLTFLGLEGNRITDLTPLIGLTNLESLSLRQNLLTNIDPLLNIPQLSYVHLGLNLLNVNSGSPVMAVVNSLQERGAYVEYWPQRQPPTILANASWLMTANTTSWLAFDATSDGPPGSQMVITAASSNAGLVPETNLAVIYNEKTHWLLATTPATNETGTLTLILTAIDDAGLSSSQPIQVTVVNPLALDNSLFHSSNLTWDTGGKAKWFGQTNTSKEGFSAARSGSIGDAQETWLRTTVPGPGILSFWWKVSSEQGYDFLRFYIDDKLQTNKISGEIDWQPQEVFIASGSHKVEWRYAKDSAVGSGTDAAWLDQVNFTRLNWLELVATPTNGQSQLSLHPIPGKLYELQASTNLADWFRLAVVAATNTTMPYLDQTADTSTRFYRLYELPASSVWFDQPKLVDNEIHLLLLSQPGIKLEMQASADLVDWSGLAVITNTLGTVEYTNVLTANFPTRYFRARVLP